MRTSTQQSIIRWLHILASIPIMGYIYGPVADIPPAAFAVKWVLIPLVVLSGLWLWKGHLVKRVLWRSRSELPSRRLQQPSRQ